ncbi:putative bifunctional diguanylate cyclase/phosphodiesterase [Chitinimonas sp. BJB300]|uniref:putative bifunctional diguanylate cyclase/phosphodiesterase n=1 Tax=Chitinimonas sp. BJB300 TaxID=1559339 RepID=UPI0013043E4A|nr:EAL domain-containing protein [Chitinimonas sp. BJB300]
MRPVFSLRSLGLLLLTVLALFANSADSAMRYRCLPDQPAWKSLEDGGRFYMLEGDLTKKQHCEIHVKLNEHYSPRWLTLKGIVQSTITSLSPHAGQAAASVVWRSSRSAGLALNAQGEALVQLYAHLPVRSEIQVQLADPTTFLAEETVETQFRTSLLFLLLSMGIVSALFARAMRDNMIGWYSGFTLAVAVFWAMLTGHAISPTELALRYPLFSQNLLLASYGFTLFFGLRFSIQFCNLAQISPRLYRCQLSLSLLILGLTLLGFVPALFPLVINYFNLVALLTLLVTFLPGLVCLARRDGRTGWLYLAGWSPVILTWVSLLLLSVPRMTGSPIWLDQLISHLQAAGFFPDWLRSPLSRQTALLAQACIFALAVASRTAKLRKKREQQALIDKATHLPNRACFLLRGNQILARHPQQQHALMMFEIADFSTINGTLGYESGDQVLYEAGQRLKQQLGKAVLLARVGNRQFAALLNEQPSENNLAILASSLSRKSFSVAGQPLDIRLRCAGAHNSRENTDLEVLMRQAEIALEAAKQGKQCARIYHPGLERDQLFQLSLFSAIRTAIAERQLTIFLQPKAFSQTGKISGAEVLLRWQHPEHGLISPNQFLPFAEKTGLIVELTRWMLAEALQLAKQWQEQGLDLYLSLNLSAADLADPNLPVYMAEFLINSRADPKLLTLEITESEVMQNPKLAVSSMRALNILGFKLSLDDFGTGNCTLAYLQDMPVSELKIDRSFVANAGHSKRGKMLLQSIITLAQTLSLHTVAEGVETAAEWEMLCEAGCDEIQGYLLAAPMSVTDFEAWLPTHQPFEKYLGTIVDHARTIIPA